MSISSMRHKLLLCRQQDVVLAGGDLTLGRQEVAWVWAQINEKAASTFSPHGAVMGDSRNVRTHQIMIRYRPLLNLSIMAWLYEERRISSPRWFKIIKVGQTEVSGTQYFNLDCRLVERGDDIGAPITAATGPLVGLPNGVRL
jgi:hypothetical protein